MPSWDTAKTIFLQGQLYRGQVTFPHMVVCIKLFIYVDMIFIYMHEYIYSVYIDHEYYCSNLAVGEMNSLIRCS